jgi:hypothetical protein
VPFTPQWSYTTLNTGYITYVGTTTIGGGTNTDIFVIGTEAVMSCAQL